MNDATMLHRSMLVMARCTAREYPNHETCWISVGPVRIAFYPASKTHRWFGKEGPIASREAERRLKGYIAGEALS
jgi:hypothetical protein